MSENDRYILEKVMDFCNQRFLPKIWSNYCTCSKSYVCVYICVGVCLQWARYNSKLWKYSSDLGTVLGLKEHMLVETGKYAVRFRFMW